MTKRAGVILVVSLLAGCSGQLDRTVSEEAINTTLVQTAVAAEQSTDYEAAAGHFANLYEKNPEDLGLLLGLARNLRYIGTPKRALEVLEQAKGVDRRAAPFLVELGKVQIASGRAADAKKTLRDVAKKTPDDWEIYSSLGIADDLLGDFRSARRNYEKALELSTGNAIVINNMALSAALSGDLDRGISVLESAPSALRDNPQLRQNLALFYGVRGDAERAETLARKDLEIDAVRNNLAVYSKIRSRRKAATYQ